MNYGTAFKKETLWTRQPVPFYNSNSSYYSRNRSSNNSCYSRDSSIHRSAPSPQKLMRLVDHTSSSNNSNKFLKTSKMYINLKATTFHRHRHHLLPLFFHLLLLREQKFYQAPKEVPHYLLHPRCQGSLRRCLTFPAKTGPLPTRSTPQTPHRPSACLVSSMFRFCASTDLLLLVFRTHQSAQELIRRWEAEEIDRSIVLNGEDILKSLKVLQIAAKLTVWYPLSCYDKFCYDSIRTNVKLSMQDLKDQATETNKSMKACADNEIYIVDGKRTLILTNNHIAKDIDTIQASQFHYTQLSLFYLALIFQLPPWVSGNREEPCPAAEEAGPNH